MKPYGIYSADGRTPVVLTVNNKGEKVPPYHVRAGTRGAARRKARQYGGMWRKDGKANTKEEK